MEFYEVLRNRRSIRGYAPDAVPEDKLDRIAYAIELAPTACNRQPFEFRFITNPDIKAAVQRCYSQPWLAQAPIIVVALGIPGKAWKRLNGTSAHTIDVSIAMEHLVLAAAAEGLATCWICAFDQDAMHRALNLDPAMEVVAISPLGFPAVAPGPFSRKPRREIVRFIK